MITISIIIHCAHNRETILNLAPMAAVVISTSSTMFQEEQLLLLDSSSLSSLIEIPDFGVKSRARKITDYSSLSRRSWKILYRRTEQKAEKIWLVVLRGTRSTVSTGTYSEYRQNSTPRARVSSKSQRRIRILSLYVLG